jgi:uncharacterized RDD family membrane protein YckC
VKCPKCDYLGFETGDRCKNCGYDFSLMADGPPKGVEIDLGLREAGDAEAADWLATAETHAAPEPAPATAPLDPRSSVPVGVDDDKLPLFGSSADDGSDEPLVKVPATPRPPLAVRRTPDTPRLRVMTPIPREESESESEATRPLQFDDDGGPPVEMPSIDRPRPSRVWKDQGRLLAPIEGDVSPGIPRAVAAAIDHAMLGGIDLAVVYFTLRMAGLPMDQWTALPAMPLFAFLLLIKLSYFCAFTTVGGQTIGKMAAGLRVVDAEGRPLDAALALRRTLAGLLSAAPLGLGFLPALLGSDRRALHDRVARTRVIALKSA